MSRVEETSRASPVLPACWRTKFTTSRATWTLKTVRFWCESQDDDGEDEEVVDKSVLYGDSIIETGVTSGSDPSDWDPIGIDQDD